MKNFTDHRNRGNPLLASWMLIIFRKETTMVRTTLILLLSVAFTSHAFLPVAHRPAAFSRLSAMFASGSRIEGNQRDPNEKELKIMDEMIDKMANAEPYELPNAVRRAFRVCSSPRFFMRIAERTDMASGEIEKEKLTALANNLATTVQTVVTTMEERLDERSKEVEQVVQKAAEPESGEFLVPLTVERIKAMRQALLDLEPSKLDEGFLSTVDAWIVKSHQDGMDGMVGILQKLLQQYAGVQVVRAYGQQNVEETAASKLFEKLMQTDTDSWEREIQQGLKAEGLTSFGLIAEIQRCMENVVLGLENGSMAQRIQAEYLKELVTRVEKLQNN
jgi:hypothetical protein